MGWKKKIKTYKSNLKSRKKKKNTDVKNCGSFKGFGYIYIDNNNNISSSMTMAVEVILLDLKSDLIKVEGEKS